MPHAVLLRVAAISTVGSRAKASRSQMLQRFPAEEEPAAGPCGKELMAPAALEEELAELGSSVVELNAAFNPRNYQTGLGCHLSE